LRGAVGIIKARRDFLAANTGRRAPMPGFVLLVRPRDDGDDAMRVGFTVTKKIGNSVVRNRLIGRAGGVERDFAQLRAELAKALGKLSR
jgi:ribonuclease P protein component